MSGHGLMEKERLGGAARPLSRPGGVDIEDPRTRAIRRRGPILGRRRSLAEFLDGSDFIRRLGERSEKPAKLRGDLISQPFIGPNQLFLGAVTGHLRG